MSQINTGSATGRIVLAIFLALVYLGATSVPGTINTLTSQVGLGSPLPLPDLRFNPINLLIALIVFFLTLAIFNVRGKSPGAQIVGGKRRR